jgi:hypothetical protein
VLAACLFPVGVTVRNVFPLSYRHSLMPHFFITAFLFLHYFTHAGHVLTSFYLDDVCHLPSSMCVLPLTTSFCSVRLRIRCRSPYYHFMTTGRLNERSRLTRGDRLLLQVKRRYTLELQERTRALVEQYIDRAITSTQNLLHLRDGSLLSGIWFRCVSEPHLQVWQQGSSAGTGESTFLEARELPGGEWTFHHRVGDTGTTYPE